ncbi:undecaprenyl-diphosphatase UppP [Patescibacteria group bacterium]|nr:undecaprenyl-diphosphatase UppP [Patescibacteria group bacterium]
MDVLSTILLSVIEGITEFLPISSTGHLILASKLLRIEPTEFTKSFDIFIQLGAIMAVVALYIKRIVQHPKLIRSIIVAFIPTGILGLVFYKIIKLYLLDNDIIVVAALAGVGALLILLEKYWHRHTAKNEKTLETLSVKELFFIGLAQSCAMIPGVSRSAASIVGGMTMGLSRKNAVEFSFLLAVPTMAAATGLDLIQSAHSFTAYEIGLLATGFIVSWITAFIVIKAFIRFVERQTFIPFGIYRIVVSILYFLSVTL